MSDYLWNTVTVIFGPEFCESLRIVLPQCNETRRFFIIGSVTLVATASINHGRLLFSDRLATLRGLEAAQQLAAAGLFAEAPDDAAVGRLRCFHCNANVGGTPEHWTVHRQASPACYLLKLWLLVLSASTAAPAGLPPPPDAAAVQSDARRYQTVLQRLRQLLSAPVVTEAAEYGISVNYLRLCAARQFMCHDCKVVERPGDLLQLAQDCELLLPSYGPAGQLDLLHMLAAALPQAGELAPENPQPQPPPPPPSRPQQPQPQQSQPQATVATDGAMDAPTTDADDRCVQCRNRTRNRVTLPCAHFLLCDRCMDGLSQCPKCGANILATVTAFIT